MSETFDDKEKLITTDQMPDPDFIVKHGGDPVTEAYDFSTPLEESRVHPVPDTLEEFQKLEPTPKKNRRKPLIAIAGIAALGAGAGIFALTGGSGEDEEPSAAPTTETIASDTTAEPPTTETTPELVYPTSSDMTELVEVQIEGLFNLAQNNPQDRQKYLKIIYADSGLAQEIAGNMASFDGLLDPYSEYDFEIINEIKVTEVTPVGDSSVRVNVDMVQSVDVTRRDDPTQGGTLDVSSINFQQFLLNTSDKIITGPDGSEGLEPIYQIFEQQTVRPGYYRDRLGNNIGTSWTLTGNDIEIAICEGEGQSNCR